MGVSLSSYFFTQLLGGVGNLIQQSRVFLAKNLPNRMICCMPKDIDVNEVINSTLSDNDSAFALRRG
ncbi:MAG: hypothetical protein ACJAZI_001169 [Cycloclasticus sp.]|jgi:hypothetical protein